MSFKQQPIKQPTKLEKVAEYMLPAVRERIAICIKQQIMDPLYKIRQRDADREGSLSKGYDYVKDFFAIMDVQNDKIAIDVLTIILRKILGILKEDENKIAISQIATITRAFEIDFVFEIDHPVKQSWSRKPYMDILFDLTDIETKLFKKLIEQQDVAEDEVLSEMSQKDKTKFTIDDWRQLIKILAIDGVRIKCYGFNPPQVQNAKLSDGVQKAGLFSDVDKKLSKDSIIDGLLQVRFLKLIQRMYVDVGYKSRKVEGASTKKFVKSVTKPKKKEGLSQKEVLERIEQQKNDYLKRHGLFDNEERSKVKVKDKWLSKKIEQLEELLQVIDEEEEDLHWLNCKGSDTSEKKEHERELEKAKQKCNKFAGRHPRLFWQESGQDILAARMRLFNGKYECYYIPNRLFVAKILKQAVSHYLKFCEQAQSGKLKQLLSKKSIDFRKVFINIVTFRFLDKKGDRFCFKLLQCMYDGEIKSIKSDLQKDEFFQQIGKSIKESHIVDPEKAWYKEISFSK